MANADGVTFWKFVEFDGDLGKNRMTRKFDSAEDRDAWNPQPLPGEGWSDIETWETEGAETDCYAETPRFGG